MLPEVDLKLLAIGCSAGGLDALFTILANRKTAFPFPVVIVQHLAEKGESLLLEVLRGRIDLEFHEAKSGETMHSGVIYVAPGNYHLLVENDYSFSLTQDKPVYGSRPSLDHFFVSAAEVFGKKFQCIVLTGNNEDGAEGAKMTELHGGTAIVQEVAEAAFPIMPRAALKATERAYVMSLAQIENYLSGIGGE